MKKYFAILLVVVMLAVSQIACGDDYGRDEDIFHIGKCTAGQICF